MSDKPDHVVRQAAEDIWSRRAPDAFERWHSPDFQNHTAPPGLDSSLASFKQVQTQFRSAFSETSVQILEQVIEGDRVASRIRVRGVHTGAFMGAEPSGKPVEISGIRMDRVKNGRIAEHWAVIDLMGLMRQISPLG